VSVISLHGTIRYWTRGTTGPTVVLLHGATLDHRAWAPQADALSDGFRVVVPDLRGHGESSGRFDFEDAVQDVLALLDQVSAPKVVLVGLSLGANIAQEVLHRDPDRVQALVVADATCNTATRAPWAAPMTVAALNAQALLVGDDFGRYAAQATAVDPQVQAYALEVGAQRSNHETVAILSSLLSTALRSEPTYRLPVPTLLVHGDRDRIGDIATGTRDWAEREPLAEYAVIPGAGHASNLDNPEEFTAVLRAFLDRVTSPLELVDGSVSAVAAGRATISRERAPSMPVAA
jgi:pimeloyl-ACP methyl ester carboxylesterase